MGDLKKALLHHVGPSGVWMSTIGIILCLVELYVELCQIGRILGIGLPAFKILYCRAIALNVHVP